jgi:hypothetical protein
MSVSEELLCNFDVLKPSALGASTKKERRWSESKAWEKALSVSPFHCIALNHDSQLHRLGQWYGKAQGKGY